MGAITLKPIRPKDPKKNTTRETPENSRNPEFEHLQVYALVVRDTPLFPAPREIRQVISAFSDLMPDELSDATSQRYSARHRFTGAPLPNLPHYRMNPSEHAELRRQVEDLLRKRFDPQSSSVMEKPHATQQEPGKAHLQL